MTAAPESVLSLLEHSSEAFVAFDRDWRYVYVNPQAQRLLSKRRDELIGNILWDVFPPSDGMIFADEFRRAVKDRVTAEFRCHWPPLDAWYDVRACPSDEGLTVYFHDVTAQVAAEQALKESWEHIRLITDNVPALISYVDQTLRFRFANSGYGEWFGVARDRIVGRTVEELLGRAGFEFRRPYIERALRGERVRFDAPTLHQSLGLRESEVSYVPDVAAGHVRGFYVLVHDVTDRKRAQERLARAQRIAALGDWELDWQTRQVYWSPEMYVLFGVSPESFTPTVDAFFAAVPPEDHDKLRRTLEASLEHRTPYHVDHRIVRPDGTVRLVLEQAEFVQDPGGAPLRLVGTMLDITERVQSEAALRDSERLARESRERLRAALSAAEMGTWRLDLRTNVATRDAEMSRLLGLPPEEASESAEQFFARLHPDDRPAAEASARRAIADCGTYLAEFRVVRPDGSVRWLREQGKVICEDGPAGENPPLYMTGATVDISDRKRAEQAVREANQRMLAVMDASPLAVMALDPRGMVMMWNPAAERVFGWNADETVGHPLRALPAEERAASAEILRRTLAGEPAVGLEVRRLRKDGTTFDAALWTSPLFDDAGRPIACLGMLADVTDRKLGEAALEQARRDAESARAVAEAANRAKDEFLAVLSHELRTPLTPVVMTLAGLELDRSLSQDVRDDLAMIRRNVELETKLIDDLLDVTRITHGKLRLHPQPTNVHALVESVLDILRSDVRGKRIELQCEPAAPDALVSGDAARLQQVIWNLVKNAIKFAPEGGRVTLRTANPSPRRLCLEVSDDGIGIDPAALPRLFNAFEQAEQSVTRQFGGLGLGLAISKALVELHGGTIQAHSAGRGRGATFVVELPTVGAVERLINQIQPEPGIHSAGTDGRRAVRVLLVEDHADTLRTLKRLLEKMGYHVIPAASAAAALSALAAEPVDVLVSDIGLPDATGHELMRTVRASHDLPGIAVSGFGMDADLKNSRDAGFIMHITKPVDLKQLDAAIRTAVRAPARK